VENQKYECGGRLKNKNKICYGGNSSSLNLRQMKFGTIRDHGHTYKLYLYHFCKGFKYGDGTTFVVILGETLNRSV
jgi:hypothetical protein